MDYLSHVLVAPAQNSVPAGSQPSPHQGGRPVAGIAIPYHSTPSSHLQRLTFSALCGAGFLKSSFGAHVLTPGDDIPVKTSISEVCTFTAFALSALPPTLGGSASPGGVSAYTPGPNTSSYFQRAHTLRPQGGHLDFSSPLAAPEPPP